MLGKTRHDQQTNDRITLTKYSGVVRFVQAVVDHAEIERSIEVFTFFVFRLQKKKTKEIRLSVE
jgi:hypothetical protein